MYEIITTVLSLIGVSTIIGAIFTYFFQKRKEIFMKESELKQKRYLCTILLMYAYLNKEELNSLQRVRPEIKNLTELRKELITEWVNSWIFASDNTLLAFKEFIESPSEKTFAKTVLSMRKESGGKNSKLPVDFFTLESFSKEN